MSGIFDEQNMIKSLSGNFSEGETFVAGAFANAKETSIKRVYSNCVPVFDAKKQVDYILPARDENGEVLEGAVMFKVEKIKYAEHSVYVGITQNYLILTECGENMHFYQFGIIDSSPFSVDLTEKIRPQDIVFVAALADIQKSEVKKGLFGAVKLNVTMKDGSYFKVVFPKKCGKMPNHEQYRDKICERLLFKHN